MAPGVDGVLDDSIAPFPFGGWREAHCLGASVAIRPKRALATACVLENPMQVVSAIDADYLILTSTLFTSVWFVHDISLCFSADCAIHNYQLVKERSTITASKSLEHVCTHKPNFNVKDDISSVLIPNADTEMPKTRHRMCVVQPLHVQSPFRGEAPSGGAWASAQTYVPAHGAGTSDQARSHQAVDPSSAREGDSMPSQRAACTWSNIRTWEHGSSCP